MKVAMPQDNTYGWGIAGTYLSAEIAKLPPVAGVTLHSIAGHHFAPTFADQWNRINIGYCFFESEIIAYRFIPEAAERWDHIVAGSSWCEHHLRIAGMDRTSTILQGVDPLLFYPLPPRADDGRFIIFSGGKFEFRKGHDLVIAAMRIFMNNHPDVWLACAWHNHWPASIQTMEQSRHMQFYYRNLPCEQLYTELLTANGIPADRVILYPLLDNQFMQQAYANSDAGLFPNRCEGGNNMVMCEYMACGRTVIASPMTGHQDVITNRNAQCLRGHEPIISVQDGTPTGVWFEASVDDILSHLEQAYADRPGLTQRGIESGTSMTALTWQDAARKFHVLAEQLAEARRASEGIAVTGNTLQDAADYFQNGCYVKAELSYRTLIQKAPFDPDLYNNLGTVLDRRERYAEAVFCYEKALALRGDFIEARFNLANTLKRNGDSHGAIENLEAVVAALPEFLEAWQNLALCRLESGDLKGSVEALEQVLLINPACNKSRTDLGEILIESGRYQEALNCFDEVLRHDPDNAGVLNSKGIALQWLNDLDTAESCYRKILETDACNTLALNNLGAVMRSKSLPDKAIEFFSRALEFAPKDGKIVLNRSLAHLSMGNFAEGWDDYESRFACNDHNQLRHLDLPRWRGEKLADKRILLWCEQGYGDSIQFIRYAKALADIGAEVLVEAQDARIAPLLARAKGVSEVFLRGCDFSTPDFQIPILSLPGVLGNIPCPPLYLEIKDDEIAFWDSLIIAEGRPKIGIAWAGRPAHENDRNRSIPPRFFEPLSQCSDVFFVSLQFSPTDMIVKPGLLDLSSHVTDFVDSASLIAGLDLVISVDSAVAHLAGALGIPVWILLPYNPDWRWLLGRDDTPWYDSARLFRQHKPSHWHEVMDLVTEQLLIHLHEKKNKVFGSLPDE